MGLLLIPEYFMIRYPPSRIPDHLDTKMIGVTAKIQLDLFLRNHDPGMCGIREAGILDRM
jgi:hypothetical protein